MKNMPTEPADKLKSRGVTTAFSRAAKQWRENYYVSHLLSGIAKPLYSLCDTLAYQLRRKVRRNGVTIDLPQGRTLSIARDSGIGMASLLFWSGLDGYERETSRTLQFFFHRSETFVDIGANYGLYSILGAVLNPNLRVVAFEPVPGIYDGLKRNVALNQLDQRITCENLALANRSGPTTLYLPETKTRDLESTATLASESWQARKGARQLAINSVSFDDYERCHPMRVDLVKIDVEDFEAGVLAGMSEVIRRDRPFIVCEVLTRDHRNERTRELLRLLGYTSYWITPEGYVRVSKFGFVRKEYKDFLFSPVSCEEEILETPAVLWALRPERISCK